MKALKILIGLFALMLVSTICSIPADAQTADLEIKKNDSYRTYSKSHTADTIEGVEALGKSIYVERSEPYHYDIVVEADSMAQDSTAYFLLYASTDGETYYVQDTITWHISAADTSVIFQSSSTVRWRWLQPMIKGNDTGTKARLGDIKAYLTGSQ